MLSASFLDFIKQERLFQKDEPLLLAISGGLDSVVLAHLLKLNNFQFCMAHMNFQLRGEESDNDERFVTKLAEQLEVEIFIKKVQIDKNSGSTQIQARELRYAWFEELLRKHDFAKLLTAHHANDLLETALLNLSRGTGVKGLRSILPLQNRVARPLLFAEKLQLEQFAVEKSIQWREDSSNATDHYARNKIRHNIIPPLLTLNPKLITGFQQTALRLRATEEAWNEKLKAVSSSYFSQKGRLIEIDKAVLDINHALVILSELLAEYGFSLAQLQAFDFGRIGAQLSSLNYVLSVDRNYLFLEEANGTDYPSFFPKEISLGNRLLQTPFGTIGFTFVGQEDIKFEKNPNVVFMDYNCIEDPIEIDLWQVGDKIQPLGMKGRKKISDILIDQKVPLPKKKETMVMKSNGEVIWVIGLKSSDSVKIRPETSKVVRVEYKGISLSCGDRKKWTDEG